MIRLVAANFAVLLPCIPRFKSSLSLNFKSLSLIALTVVGLRAPSSLQSFSIHFLRSLCLDHLDQFPCVSLSWVVFFLDLFVWARLRTLYWFSLSWVMERPSSPSFSVLHYLKGTYVAFAFCSALILGALKGIVVGPIACLILITGNVGVILGLFPAHVTWTVGAIIKTKRFVLDLKLVLLFSIPFLFGFWLVVGITGSVLVGFGYGFFTPWVSTFEAFRQDGEFTKFSHCVVDGTWDTIKGSCVVVRDFADICYHSYPLYLKETSERTTSDEPQTIRLMEVPKCIIIGLMGLIVEIPLFTIIAVTKSPFMLFKGWQRLLHDLVSREGPFLETACVPIAGLAILLWPLVVLGSILLSIFSSFFIGLYGAVVVYQERSFRRGLAYVIAMVAEFDEYTNDLLYLREGSPLPKPGYRKKIEPQNKDFSNGIDHVSATQHLRNNTSNTSEAPGMLVPNLAHTRSVREAIQEVKMVQVWEEIMRSYEANGKQLVDANVITTADLAEYGRATKLKSNSISNSSGGQASIIGHGLPSYSCLNALLRSIKMGSEGWVLSNGVELTHANRPQDRLMDWFFHPLLVLKEQIKAIKMVEGEVRFLEKFTLFSGDEQGMEAWNNGSVVPQDALRNAQIQAISRRLQGMTRIISKFPTYRRRYQQVVKSLTVYCLQNEGMYDSISSRSTASIEIV